MAIDPRQLRCIWVLATLLCDLFEDMACRSFVCVVSWKFHAGLWPFLETSFNWQLVRILVILPAQDSSSIQIAQTPCAQEANSKQHLSRFWYTAPVYAWIFLRLLPLPVQDTIGSGFEVLFGFVLVCVCVWKKYHEISATISDLSRVNADPAIIYVYLVPWVAINSILLRGDLCAWQWSSFFAGDASSGSCSRGGQGNWVGASNVFCNFSWISGFPMLNGVECFVWMGRISKQNTSWRSALRFCWVCWEFDGGEETV